MEVRIERARREGPPPDAGPLPTRADRVRACAFPRAGEHATEERASRAEMERVFRDPERRPD